MTTEKPQNPLPGVDATGRHPLLDDEVLEALVEATASEATTQTGKAHGIPEAVAAAEKEFVSPPIQPTLFSALLPLRGIQLLLRALPAWCRQGGGKEVSLIFSATEEGVQVGVRFPEIALKDEKMAEDAFQALLTKLKDTDRLMQRESQIDTLNMAAAAGPEGIQETLKHFIAEAEDSMHKLQGQHGSSVKP